MVKTQMSRIHSIIILAIVGLLCGGFPASAQNVLTTAAEIRRLTPDQANRHVRVRLQGTVTFYDENLFSRFIQDDTAGIYLREMVNMPALKPGQIVQVEGVTSAGEFAPVVIPQSVVVVSNGVIPEAKPVSVEELLSGNQDSQRVEISGIIRAIQFETESRNYRIELATGSGRISAYAQQLPSGDSQSLVDSTVKARGVCATLFNRQRQLFGTQLLIPRPEDLILEKASSPEPFDIPAQTIGSLLRFAPQGIFGHRVKVTGAVVYQEPGKAIFIADGPEGLYCQSHLTTPLEPGDRVEVLGFPAKGEYTPKLEDAIYRKTGAGPPPAPDAVDLNQVLTGAYDSRLIQIKGRLLEQVQRGHDHFMVLGTGGFVFQAILAQGDTTGAIQNGSLVSVTGICLIERGSNWQAGSEWRAKSFRLLLRSARDIAVVESPPWWTLERVLWFSGALGLIALIALAWVGILRREVSQKTAIIERRLQAEAALRERYEDLLENANDMVFTHDLDGKMTSINKTGEQLLKKSRHELLQCNLMEIIAEKQRTAARQWLAQVIQGIDVPTAEWDFIDATGQKIKLETNSRLIQQDGKPVEIETIARDVTEHRRLEHELLEISNREQRRIGHDLHDGVCQDLAAITFLMNILGDRLLEKQLPEAAEAGRIETLIKDANTKARDVARGLFPSRLDEQGLVVALEELTIGASRRFQIPCRFVSEAASVKLDANTLLHLYYIAQEALLNAINHGKPTQVSVSLASTKDQLKLTVQDDGCGFKTSGKNRGGMGVRIMKYRAEVIGAVLSLHSQEQRGTLVECLIHMTPPENLKE